MRSRKVAIGAGSFGILITFSLLAHCVALCSCEARSYEFIPSMDHPLPLEMRVIYLPRRTWDLGGNQWTGPESGVELMLTMSHLIEPARIPISGRRNF